MGETVRRGDVQIWPVAGKAEVLHALHILAYAHTVAAENALVEIERDGGAGEIHPHMRISSEWT